MTTVVIVCAVLAALAVGGSIFFARRYIRHVLVQVNTMLEEATDASFTVKQYDESMLSATEEKLANYLAASAVSARQVQDERDKLKSLVADISHQTKTPVANLLLYTQLLAEHDLPPDAQVCVDVLDSQAKKLQTLIDALVKTSRLETGVLVLHPARAPLAPMLDEAVAQNEAKARAKSIALQYEPTDRFAMFDPKWTGEAVHNLLDNAIKYTPPGGTVSVRAIAYNLFCRIDVADTGIGVAEEERAKVFERFYRAKQAYDTEGVGIGLYLVRQIAAGQGGYVKVSAKPGGGSVFSLFLPI